MEEKKPYSVIVMKDHGEFNLCKPTFEVLAVALGYLLKQGNDQQLVKAGKVLFDACYLGNNKSLEELNADPALYVSLCIVAAEELDIHEGELKKN